MVFIVSVGAISILIAGFSIGSGITTGSALSFEAEKTKGKVTTINA